MYENTDMGSLVNGKMIPLNEVQEEDQRNMTTDEYKVTIIFINLQRKVIYMCLFYRLIMKLGKHGKIVNNETNYYCY